MLLPIAAIAAGKDQQFTYSTTDGITATITGYTGPGGDVTIPRKIDGLPVTAIGDFVFYDAAPTITGVTIPRGVLNIQEAAFSGDANMASVSIPNTVTNIGMGAFSFCLSLTDVTIPDSVRTLGDYALDACLSLTNVTVGAGLESMGEGVFSWTFFGLKSIYFKGDAPTVGPGVFDYTYSATVYCHQDTAGWEQFQNDTYSYVYGISTPVVALNPKHSHPIG